MRLIAAGFANERLQRGIDLAIFGAGALSLVMAIALTLAGLFLPAETIAMAAMQIGS